MKSITSFNYKWLFMLFVFSFFVIPKVWGTDYVYKTAKFGSAAFSSTSVNNYTSSSTASSHTGFSVTTQNGNNNQNKWDHIRFGRNGTASTGTITTGTIDKKITKVTINFSSITAAGVTSVKLYTSSNGSSWTDRGNFTLSSGAQSVSIAAVNQAVNLYYKIELVCKNNQSSNGYVQINYVQFYIDSSDVDSYVLVTSAASLSSGDIIVLGSAANNAVASGFSSSYLTAADATVSAGTLYTASALEFTLGGSAGSWTLTNGTKTLRATSATALDLNTSGGVNTWTISIGSSPNYTASIAASVTYTTGIIYYNTGAPRFKNYTSAQAAIEVYKKVSACSAPTGLNKGTISLSDRTAQVQPINWTSEAGKVDICYSTNSSKPGATPGSGYTVVSNITSSPYNLNITSFAADDYYVWARSVCDESTKSDWLAITGSYFTVPGHTLTISADPDGSGTFSKSPDISNVVENRQVDITASPAAGYTFTSWAVSGTGSTLSSTSDNPTTFTMGTANATVTATFTAKEVTGWTWKQQSTGETEITIPDVVDLYVGQQAWFNLKSYTPADVIAGKKGYSSSYTNTYLAQDNKAETYYKTRAKAVTESTTLTLTSSSNSSVTQEITIRIKALPSVTFTDIIHGETFGAVTATVDATDKRVVYTTKKTPTHDDLDEPGSGNDCEKQHLHLAGWILKDWADLHPDATSSEISGAGSGNFYSTNADIDLVAKNGKTFYAVWSKLE